MKSVFLDIDGVLQPRNANERFNHINSNKIVDLCEEFDTDYFKYNIYDVYAVYYDWNKEAVKRLKKLLELTRSRIIVSSEWRAKNYPDKMYDLLKIHGLDKFYYGDTPFNDSITSIHRQKASEIEEAINNYNVSDFVVLDDMRELQLFFPDNIVLTNNLFDEDNMYEAINILTRKM